MADKIYNGTAHPITIIDRASARIDEKLRKWVSDDPKVIMEIPVNKTLNAIIKTEFFGNYEGIPVYDKNIVDCDPTPDADVIIVSQLYAIVARTLTKRNSSKLYTVADPVYTPDGRTVLGSLGICSAF